MADILDTKDPFDKSALSDAHPLPLYLQLSRYLRDLILTGQIRHQDALPGERELAEKFAVSRVTVRKAIHELTTEGLLQQRQGAGTFVIRNSPAKQPLSILTSFSEDLRLRGISSSSLWLQRRISVATSEESSSLDLSPRETVARLHRLLLADGTPIAIELSVIPSRFLLDPSKVEHSLYATLRQEGHAPHRAWQKITAVKLTDVQANLLQVPSGSPALFIERHTALQDGTPLQFSRAQYRNDVYDFIVEFSLAGQERSFGEYVRN